MARISLIDEKLDKQNNGRNIILFDVFFGKLFNFNILIMIYYSDSNGKKLGRYAKCNFKLICRISKLSAVSPYCACKILFKENSNRYTSKI